MRKHLLTLLLISLSIASFAQTAIEIQKAKVSAKSYLLKFLNNPSSYRPGSWDKLQKTYSSFSETKRAQEIEQNLRHYRDAKFDMMVTIPKMQYRIGEDYEKDSTYVKAVELEKEASSGYDSILIVQEKAEKAYKPVFDGYRIEHTFRARNKFNALVLQTYYFLFSKSFKVIAAGDADELERERQDLQRRIDELTGGK